MTAPAPALHLVERAARQLRQRDLPGMPGPLPMDTPAANAAAGQSFLQNFELIEGADVERRTAQQQAVPEPARAGAAAPAPLPTEVPAKDRESETITARQLERGGMIGQMTERNRMWEEFRIAQHQLMLEPPGGRGTTRNGTNLCLVTSALPGEGKTFCAVNMAASLARYSSRKILLVDLDAKPNSLTRALGIAKDRFGIWDLAANPGANPTGAVIATELPNLFFAPIGAYDQYASLSIAPAVRELGRQFSGYLLLLDAAPCLCSSTPATLAALVGQIVFVVEAERTQRSEVEAALDLIEACPNIRLLLNKIQSSASYTFGTYHHEYREAAGNSR